MSPIAEAAYYCQAGLDKDGFQVKYISDYKASNLNPNLSDGAEDTSENPAQPECDVDSIEDTRVNPAELECNANDMEDTSVISAEPECDVEGIEDTSVNNAQPECDVDDVEDTTVNSAHPKFDSDDVEKTIVNSAQPEWDVDGVKDTRVNPAQPEWDVDGAEDTRVNPAQPECDVDGVEDIIVNSAQLECDVEDSNASTFSEQDSTHTPHSFSQSSANLDTSISTTQEIILFIEETVQVVKEKCLDTEKPDDVSAKTRSITVKWTEKDTKLLRQHFSDYLYFNLKRTTNEGPLPSKEVILRFLCSVTSTSLTGLSEHEQYQKIRIKLSNERKTLRE